VKYLVSNKESLKTFFSKYLLTFILLATFTYSIVYVAQRSFWIDESMVALAIVKSGLSPFEPLAIYNQVSPWGFVLLTRLSQALFGAGDLQFRLPGLLFYLTGMFFIARFFKQRYGLLAASAMTIAMLSNPLLLQYSTEFKHYIFEFTFVVFILVNYLRWKDEETRTFWAYAASIFFSIIFGVSIVFIIGAIFIFESFHQIKRSPRNFIRSNWLILHAVYGVLFLVWYIFSIRPNLAFNLMNYPHIYGVDLGPANLTNLKHWGKVLVNAIFSMMVPQSVLLLICLSGFLINRKWERRPSNWAILLLPVLVYLIIYAANFSGYYPILIDRHLLYTLPVFYLLFIYALAHFSSTFDLKWLKAAAPGMLILMSLVTLGIHHVNNQFFFQEIKPVLAEVQPDDDLFVYFTAQPGYDWYQLTRYPELPEPLNPRVSPASGPAIPLEEMIADLPNRIEEPGAWPTIALLTQLEDAYLYEEDYMGDMIIREGKSLLVISHRSGLYLRNYLEETCGISRIFRRPGASVYQVDCP
jgi:hypothetical protein